MADPQPSRELTELKKSVDTLILIELCKAGASYSQIREIMGKADNNVISKVNNALNGKPRNETRKG